MTNQPTDRAIAQAFREYFAGPLLMSSGSLLDAKGRIERRAHEIDAAAPSGAQAPVVWWDGVKIGSKADAAKALSYKPTAWHSMPLYAAPPAASEDAADAARYRFLRDPGNAIVYAKDPANWNGHCAGPAGWFHYESPEHMDAAIDAARGAEGA